ncbi:hypothetical protein BDV33DRAFT_163015 [Aspergillus novoparasiticus]|uniref:Uncharacterized protein n=1 Tax=Aspergillus novoparasiticus TaxID=986946 RepID=A0A5N6FB95_9EURO|nr:hypothetical protein BDV33DRAFT_163015 [Aspergillus novoparasiticus]
MERPIDSRTPAQIRRESIIRDWQMNCLNPSPDWMICRVPSPRLECHSAVDIRTSRSRKKRGDMRLVYCVYAMIFMTWMDLVDC